jgi:hypothetical protein
MNTRPYQGEGQGPQSSGRNQAPANSILVADCGTVFTKVSLLGIVEGQYRLMACSEAPTTVSAPHEDITQGIIQAISQIEFITGRRLVVDGRILSPEKPNGDGVDVFVATVSAGGPIRLVVLGAVSAMLETLAAQAVSGLSAETYALPAPSYVATSMPAPLTVGAGAAVGGASVPPSPAGPGTQWTPERVALEWERQLERMRDLQPHAALIVGLADGPAGPTPLQEASQLLVNAVQELNEQRGASASAGIAAHDLAAYQLPVIYAGAPQYVEAVRRMLHDLALVAQVDPLASPAQVGPIGVATTTLYERNVLQHIPGYDRLRSWSNAAPVAAAASVSSLVRFLSQHYSMNVTAVDVGGATTTVMVAGEKGEFVPIVNSGVGIGSGIGEVFQKAGLQRLARWLPFEVSEDELRQYVLNRMLHPQVIPTNLREFQISQAFVREAILLTSESARYSNSRQIQPDLIVATGSVFARAPKYGQVVLMLLDTLQPRGVTSIVLDRTMLVPQLGAVATVAPVAAVQVNENDAVTQRLGTCIIPFGEIQPGQPALRVGLEYSNGQQSTIEVMGGTIAVVPLRLNEQAALTLTPAPTVDVGLGPGERARAAEEIDGGLVGLIIDARGRPLSFASNETERRARLLQWMQALDA